MGNFLKGGLRLFLGLRPFQTLEYFNEYTHILTLASIYYIITSKSSLDHLNQLNI